MNRAISVGVNAQRWYRGNDSVRSVIERVSVLDRKRGSIRRRLTFHPIVRVQRHSRRSRSIRNNRRVVRAGSKVPRDDPEGFRCRHVAVVRRRPIEDETIAASVMEARDAARRDANRRVSRARGKEVEDRRSSLEPIVEMRAAHVSAVPPCRLRASRSFARSSAVHPNNFPSGSNARRDRMRFGSH